MSKRQTQHTRRCKSGGGMAAGKGWKVWRRGDEPDRLRTRAMRKGLTHQGECDTHHNRRQDRLSHALMPGLEQNNTQTGEQGQSDRGEGEHDNVKERVSQRLVEEVEDESINH